MRTKYFLFLRIVVQMWWKCLFLSVRKEKHKSKWNTGYFPGVISDIAASCFLSLQTILIQNIYRNPQNSAQTADASRCEYKPFSLLHH